MLKEIHILDNLIFSQSRRDWLQEKVDINNQSVTCMLIRCCVLASHSFSMLAEFQTILFAPSANVGLFRSRFFFIFEGNTGKFYPESLFPEILSQYGNYIECLKYYGSKIYESVPAFPPRGIMGNCIQLNYIKRFERVAFKNAILLIRSTRNSPSTVQIWYVLIFWTISLLTAILCTHLTDETRCCLSWLAGKPIEQLYIEWDSEDSLSPFVSKPFGSPVWCRN